MNYSTTDVQRYIEDTDGLVKSWILPNGHISTQRMESFKRALNEYAKGNKRYAYFITFTKDPQKNLPPDNTIEKRIIKMLKSKTANAKYCVYVREGGDDSHKHVHWHVLLESYSYIKKSDLTRTYTKNIGNVDFQTKTDYNYTKPLLYMAKQNTPITLIDKRA